MAIKGSSLRKVYFAGCLLMIVVSVMGIWNAFEKKRITEIGKTVKVDVIEAPFDCSKVTTRGGYCKLSYKGEIFGKRAGIEFCHLVSKKKTVNLLTNKEEDVFLFIGEYNPMQFVYTGAIFVIAIIVGIKGLKT